MIHPKATLVLEDAYDAYKPSCRIRLSSPQIVRMGSANPDRNALVPLAYHAAVAEYLKQHEPEVWQWASQRDTQEEQLESLRASLLRDSYRIEPEAHADVHAALANAMARLGIAAPATLYQSSGLTVNAMLIYVPGEIHIVLQGPLLERLTPDELLAVFGHELSHYLLWSERDGQFLVADRILSQSQSFAGSQASHQETFRRYVLHTELFADRGGAIAANALAPAITALVKVQTGMGLVDATAYLRQAIEIETSESSASQAFSHPETFLRARALALWWESSEELGPWLNRRLLGPLVLERLDLPGQMQLQTLTRGFMAHFLNNEYASDAVVAQIRTLFPDWSENEPALEPAQFAPEFVDDGVRGMLNALMLDLALADPDQQEAALLRAGKVAQALGSFDALLINLRRDAGFGKREMDRYKRQLAKEAKA